MRRSSPPLLQGGTITRAAETLGISPRTIYTRMEDVHFRQRYGEARNDILRGAQAIREMDAASQQKLAYALVITLCNALGTQRVRFFFDSGAPETLGTDVFWGGEFLLNHALLEQSRG